MYIRTFYTIFFIFIKKLFFLNCYGVVITPCTRHRQPPMQLAAYIFLYTLTYFRHNLPLDNFVCQRLTSSGAYEASDKIHIYNRRNGRTAREKNMIILFEKISHISGHH